MKYLNISHYVFVLLNEGTKWEFERILNGGVTLTKKQITQRSLVKRFILAIPTLFVCFILKEGINSDCVGYAMAALSIFIGLFSSLIITMYDRYVRIPDLSTTANHSEILEDKKMRNFIRQFTFVTGKNLLIAIVMIALMSLILIAPKYLSVNPFKSYFIASIKELNFSAFLIFINNSLAIFVRGILVYLVFDFFILLLYSLGALFSFLKKEYR